MFKWLRETKRFLEISLLGSPRRSVSPWSSVTTMSFQDKKFHIEHTEGYGVKESIRVLQGLLRHVERSSAY
jgi:hypothetical protein